MSNLFKQNREIQILSLVPLTLALLLIIYHKNKSLPETSIQVYEQIFDILLHSWETSKELEEFNINSIELYQILQILSYKIQKDIETKGLKLDLDESRSILEKYFIQTLGKSFKEVDKKINSLYNAISVRPSIVLIEHHQITFWHRAFQEFLVAKSLELQFPSHEDIHKIIGNNINNSSWQGVITFYHGLQNKRGPLYLEIFWKWLYSLKGNNVIYTLISLYLNYNNLNAKYQADLWDRIISPPVEDEVSNEMQIGWFFYIFDNITKDKDLPKDTFYKIVDFVIQNFELLRNPLYSPNTGKIYLVPIEVILHYFIESYYEEFIQYIIKNYEVRKTINVFVEDNLSNVELEMLLLSIDLLISKKNELQLIWHLWSLVKNEENSDIDNFNQIYKNIRHLITSIRRSGLILKQMRPEEFIILISGIKKKLPEYFQNLSLYLPTKPIYIHSKSKTVDDKIDEDREGIRGSLLFIVIRDLLLPKNRIKAQTKFIDYRGGKFKELISVETKFKIGGFKSHSIPINQMIERFEHDNGDEIIFRYYLDLENLNIRINITSHFENKEELDQGKDQIATWLNNLTAIDGITWSDRDEITILNEAKSKFENQEYKEAIDIAMEALQLNHRLYGAFRIISLSYKNLNDFRKFLETNQRIYNMFGFHKQIAIDLSHALALNKKYEIIIHHFENEWILNQNEFDATLFNNVGAGYAETNNFKQAIKFYKKALEADESFILSWRNLMNILAKINKIDDIENELVLFVKTNPKVKEECIYHVCQIYYTILREYDRAFNKGKLLVELNPNNKEYYYTLSHICMLLENYVDSLELINAALDIDSDFIEAWGLKAQICKRLNLDGDKKTAYKQVIELSSKFHVEARSFGVALIENRELDIAKQIYEEIINNKNHDDNAYYNLACIYALKDNIHSSIRYLKLAIKYARNNIGYRQLASEDTDFDKIRNNKKFRDFMNN